MNWALGRFVGRRLLVFEKTLSPVLNLQVARTPEELRTGLSGRTSIDLTSGMIFMFPAPGRHGIWMKGTYLSLDVAWLNERGEAVHLKQLAPLDERTHTPPVPAAYVVELLAGSFDKFGLRLGDRLIWL